MDDLAELVALVGRRMFERRLTDMAGGNVSGRDGNRIFISPRYSGAKKHWQLNASDVVTGTLEDDSLLSHPLFSREGKAHLAVYRNFPDVHGIIHAHPFHVMPFAAAGKPIDPVLESTEKFGRVEVIPFAPSHSVDLARNVVEGLRGREDNIRKQAAAVLMPRHGILVAGKDLLAAIDSLERIDWNAWCIIAMRLLQ